MIVKIKIRSLKGDDVFHISFDVFLDNASYRFIDLGDRSEGIGKKCRRLTLDSDQRRGWKFENLIMIEEIGRNR